MERCPHLPPGSFVISGAQKLPDDFVIQEPLVLFLSRANLSDAQKFYPKEELLSSSYALRVQKTPKIGPNRKLNYLEDFIKACGNGKAIFFHS